MKWINQVPKLWSKWIANILNIIKHQKFSDKLYYNRNQNTCLTKQATRIPQTWRDKYFLTIFDIEAILNDVTAECSCNLTRQLSTNGHQVYLSALIAKLSTARNSYKTILCPSQMVKIMGVTIEVMTMVIMTTRNGHKFTNHVTKCIFLCQLYLTVYNFLFDIWYREILNVTLLYKLSYFFIYL